MTIAQGLIALAVLIVLVIFSGIVRGAPFVPTKREAVHRLINFANLKPGERLADLGSGDGRIVIAAARAGAEAHGFEINPLLVLASRRKIKKAGLDGRAFIHWKNFWREDLSGYDVITIYGLGSIMKGLEKKLNLELAPAGRVLSYIFPLPTWTGEKVGALYKYQRKNIH
jgi:hypothetical protein